jgi:hypothetical protein
MIICFCPPRYYGEKCEFHSDRRILLQLLVLFLFKDEVLMIDHFHLYPPVESDSLLNNEKTKTKFISDFVFPRLLFSIRLELYQTRLNDRSSIIANWKSPLSFTHLLVSRLSRILHRLNPCSSNPCRRNEQPIYTNLFVSREWFLRRPRMSSRLLHFNTFTLSTQHSILTTRKQIALACVSIEPGWTAMFNRTRGMSLPSLSKQWIVFPRHST